MTDFWMLNQLFCVFFFTLKFGISMGGTHVFPTFKKRGDQSAKRPRDRRCSGGKRHRAAKRLNFTLKTDRIELNDNDNNNIFMSPQD